jgi:hypothetical protein
MGACCVKGAKQCRRNRLSPSSLKGRIARATRRDPSSRSTEVSPWRTAGAPALSLRPSPQLHQQAQQGDSLQGRHLPARRLRHQFGQCPPHRRRFRGKWVPLHYARHVQGQVSLFIAVTATLEGWLQSDRVCCTPEVLPGSKPFRSPVQSPFAAREASDRRPGWLPVSSARAQHPHLMA